jgi:hypothetical protein
MEQGSPENEQEENHEEQMEQGFEKGVQLGQPALAIDFQVEMEQDEDAQTAKNQNVQAAENQVAIQVLGEHISPRVQGQVVQADETQVDQATKVQRARQQPMHQSA